MALDVTVPDPPSLRDPQDPGPYQALAVDEEEVPMDDFRRETIAVALDEGAWADAFDEWAATTYLTEDEFEVVTGLSLIDEFDFYWDPADAEVGYITPDLPESLPDEYDRRLNAGDIDGIEEELDSLGRTVSERLEDDYLRRDQEEFGFFADE